MLSVGTFATVSHPMIGTIEQNAPSVTDIDEWNLIRLWEYYFDAMESLVECTLDGDRTCIPRVSTERRTTNHLRADIFDTVDISIWTENIPDGEYRARIVLPWDDVTIDHPYFDGLSVSGWYGFEGTLSIADGTGILTLVSDGSVSAEKTRRQYWIIMYVYEKSFQTMFFLNVIHKPSIMAFDLHRGTVKPGEEVTLRLLVRDHIGSRVHTESVIFTLSDTVYALPDDERIFVIKPPDYTFTVYTGSSQMERTITVTAVLENDHSVYTETTIRIDHNPIQEVSRIFLLSFGETAPGSSLWFHASAIDQYGEDILDVDITWFLNGYVEGDRISFHPWGIILHFGEIEDERELTITGASTVNPLVYSYISYHVYPNPYAHAVKIEEPVGVLREGEHGSITIPLSTQNIPDGGQLMTLHLPLGIAIQGWDLPTQYDNWSVTGGWMEIVNGTGELIFLYDGTTEAGTWEVLVGIGLANILFPLTIEPPK